MIHFYNICCSSLFQVTLGNREKKWSWILAGIWVLLVATDPVLTFWGFYEEIIFYTDVCASVKEGILNTFNKTERAHVKIWACSDL